MGTSGNVFEDLLVPEGPSSAGKSVETWKRVRQEPQSSAIPTLFF